MPHKHKDGVCLFVCFAGVVKLDNQFVWVFQGACKPCGGHKGGMNKGMEQQHHCMFECHTNTNKAQQRHKETQHKRSGTCLAWLLLLFSNCATNTKLVAFCCTNKVLLVSLFTTVVVLHFQFVHLCCGGGATKKMLFETSIHNKKHKEQMKGCHNTSCKQTKKKQQMCILCHPFFEMVWCQVAQLTKQKRGTVG